MYLPFDPVAPQNPRLGEPERLLHLIVEGQTVKALRRQFRR